MIKLASLNLICMMQRWNDLHDRILSCCRQRGIEVLNVDASEYWKDSQCTQAFFALSADIPDERWQTFFHSVFGTENNILFSDSLTHCGSPILNETEIFGELSYMDCDRIYEFFEEALSHCGLFLLDLSDEDIGWHLFEEFDGDCCSFLDQNTLASLRASGKITTDIANAALLLSQKFRALEHTELWNIASVRTNTRWGEILALSDAIKKDLYT